MVKKFDPDYFRNLLNCFPSVKRVEFYGLIEANAIGPHHMYLKCIEEYPLNSGGVGLILPTVFLDYIFSRIISSFGEEEFLSGVTGLERASRKILLEAHRVAAFSFEEPEHQDFGVSVYRRGKPEGLLLFRCAVAEDSCQPPRVLLAPASEILEKLYQNELETLWPRFSILDGGWPEKFTKVAERNTLPLDLKQIRQALGGSENVFFEAVIPGFLDRLPAQIEEMEENLEKSNWHALRKNNHRIKGAAASLYITHVGAASLALEQAIDDKTEAVPAAFKIFKEEIELLERFYRTMGWSRKDV